MICNRGFPDVSAAKNPPARGLGRDTCSIPVSADPFEKEMAIHSSILAWGNPMDRGAWQATVYEVTKSWT